MRSDFIGVHRAEVGRRSAGSCTSIQQSAGPSGECSPCRRAPAPTGTTSSSHKDGCPQGSLPKHCINAAIDTPLAKARRFLGGSARPLTGRRGNLHCSGSPLAGLHRASWAVPYEPLGSLPATREGFTRDTSCFLSGGSGTEKPSLLPDKRGREGLPPHCRLPHKQLRTCTSPESVPGSHGPIGPPSLGEKSPCIPPHKGASFAALLALYSIV